MPYAQLLHAALQYGGSATALEGLSDPDSDLCLPRVAPQKPEEEEEEEEEDATLLKLASALKALSPCPTGPGPLQSFHTAIERLRDSIYPLRALAMPATHKAAPCTPQFSAVCEASALAFEALAGVDFSASTTPAWELCAEVLSVAACCTSLHLCARSFAGCCSGRPRGVWRGALQGQVLESLASSANSGLFNCEDLDSIASQTATYLSTFQRLARVSGCDEEEGLALPPPLTHGAALCLSTTKLLLALRGSVSSLDWVRAGAVLQWEGTGTPLLSHSEGDTLPTPPPSPHPSYLSHALSLWKAGRVAQCAVDELFFSALCIDRVRLAGLAGSCDPSLGVEAQDQHWEGVYRAATSVESSLHHIEELLCSRDGSSSSSSSSSNNSILSVFSWGDGVSKVVLESKARASVQSLLATLPLTALHGRAGSLSAPVLVQPQLEGPGFSQPLAHLEAVIEGAQKGLSSAGLNCASPLLRSAWLVHSLRSLLLGADPHSLSSPLAVIGQCSSTHSSELACVESILSRVMREEGVQGVMRAVGMKFDPAKEGGGGVGGGGNGDDDGSVGAKELHPAIIDEVCLLISTLASHRSSIALAAAICNPGTTPLVEALEAAHTVVTALPAHLKALVVGSRSGAAESSTTQLGVLELTPPPLLPSLTLTSLLRLGAVVLQCRAAHSIAQSVTVQGGGAPSHLPSARLGLEEALRVGVDKGVIVLQPKPSTSVTLPLSVASPLPVDVVARAERELGGVRGALGHMVMAEALQRALDAGKPTFKPGTMVLQWGVEGEGEGKGEGEHGHSDHSGGGARYAAGLLSAFVSVEEGQSGGAAATPLPLPLAEQLAACKRVATLASAVDGGGGVSLVGEVEDTLRIWPFSSPPPPSLVILSQHIIHTNLTQGLQAALYNDVTTGVCGPPGALRLTNVSPTPLLTALGSLRLKGSHVPLTATTLALAQCAHTLAALRACTLFEVSGLGDCDSLGWAYEEGAKVCGGGKKKEEDKEEEEEEVVEEGLSTSDPSLVKAMRDEIRVILLDREARRIDGTLLACLDGEDINGLGVGADLAARVALLAPPSDRTPNTHLLLSTMALFQALALEYNDPWCCVNILRRVRVAGVGNGGTTLLQPSLFPCGDLPTPPTCLATVLLGDGGGGSSRRANPPSSSGTGGDAWEGIVRSCRETVSGTTTLPLHPAFFPKLRTHLYSALIKVCDQVLPTLLSHLPGVVSITNSVTQPPSFLRDFSSCASWISACLAACGGVTTAYLVPHFDRGGYVRVRDTMRVANLLRDANIAGGLGQWEVSSECLFQAVGVLGPIKEGKPPPANPLHPQDTLSRLLQCPVVPNEYPPLHASSTALFKHLQLCWSLCLTRAAVACALTLRVGGEGEGEAQHLIRAAIGALSHSSASATDTADSFSATQLLAGLLEGGRQWCGARSLLARGDKGGALELAHASLSHLTTSVPPITNWPTYLGTAMTAETSGINSPTPTSLPLLYLDFVAHVQEVSSEVLNDLVGVELDRCLAHAREGGGKGVGDFSATEQQIQGWTKGGGLLNNQALERLRVCMALFIMGGGEGGGGDYSFIKGLTFPSPWIAAAGQWVEGTAATAGGEGGGSDMDWAHKEIEKALAVNELLGCGWEIERWMTGGRVGGDVGSIHLPTHLNGSSINSILSRASASVSALERVAGIASSSSGSSSIASSSSSASPPPALLPHIAHASTLRTALIPLATALAHMRECAARVVVGIGSEGGDVGGISQEVLEGALKVSATLLVPSPFLLHSCSPWVSSTSPITKEAHLVSMHCQYLSVMSHLGVFCNGGSVASEAQCIEEGATLLGRLEGGKGGTQRGSASYTLTLTRALHCATLLKRVQGAVSVEGLWGLGEELGLPCDAGGRSHTTLHQLLSSSLATPPFSLCNPTQHTHTVLTRGKLFALDVQCAMVVWASLMEWCKVGLCGGLQLPHLYDLGMEGEEGGKGGGGEEWCDVTPLPLQHIVALANTFSDSPLLQQPGLWVCGGLFSTVRALHTLHCNWGGGGFNPALTSELEGLIGMGEGIDWRGCWGWGRLSRIVAAVSAPTSTIPFSPPLLPSPLLSVCTHALLSTRLYTALEGVITLAKGTSLTPISPPTSPSASWEGLDEGGLRAGTVALEEGLEAMRANLSSSPAILSTFPPTLLTPALHHHRLDTHPDALPTLEFIECTLGVRKAVLETEAFGVEATVHEGSSSTTTRPSLAPLMRALARLEGLCSTTSPGLKCLSTPGAALLEVARGLAAQECLLASCCLRCATLERGALRALVTESPGVDTQSLQAGIARHHSAHAGALSLGGPLTPWAERLLFTSTALLSLRQSLLGFVAAKDTPVGGPLSALVTHHLPLSPLLGALYECRRGVEEGFFLPPCIPEVESAQEVFEATVFGCVMVPILEGRVVGDGNDVGEMVEAVCKACEASGVPPSQALSHSAFTTLSAAKVASALLRAKASGDPQTMMQALGATVAAESSGEEKEEGDTHAHSHLLSFALTSLTTQVELLGAQGNLEAALQGMQCSEGCVGVSWAVGGEVGRLVLGSTPGGEHGTASRYSPLDPSHLASTPLALEAAIMEAGAILAALTLSSGTGGIGASANASATAAAAAAAAPLSSLLPLARAVLGLRKGVLSYLHGGSKVDDWRVSYARSVVHEASGLQPSPLTAYALSEAHLCMGHGQYLSHLAALESALDEGGEEGNCTHALQIPIPADAAETFLAPLLQFPAALPLLSPLPSCPPSISLPDLSRVWEGGMTPPPALNPTVTAVQGFLESGVCLPGGMAQRTLHPLITLGTTLATARRALAQGLYEEVLQAIDGGGVLGGSLGVDVGVRGVRELYLIRELALGVLERIKAAQSLSALLANPHHTHPEPLMDALAYALSIGLPFDPVLTDGEHAQLFTMALDRLCVHYGGVGYTNAAWVSEPLASGGGSGGGVTRTERGRRAGRTHL